MIWPNIRQKIKFPAGKTERMILYTLEYLLSFGCKTLFAVFALTGIGLLA